MHQLDRACVPYPTCLEQYRHGQHNWNDITLAHKVEIRHSLERLQGRRCAYCECSLEDDNQHIEHFRQRHRDPQRTFDWWNLFWSCQRQNCCGIHKDHCGDYNPEDLIKPDIEDPELFFLFVSDGSITIRRNLTDTQRRRAEETLRIFNLDAQWGPLRYMRRVAVSGYIRTAEALRELAASYPSEDWMPFLEAELTQAQDLPFCTAIKHALTPQGIE